MITHTLHRPASSFLASPWLIAVLAALVVLMLTARLASAAVLPPPMQDPPADAVAAAQALYAHMGGQPTASVSFPGGEKENITEDVAALAGFALVRADILRYTDQPKSPDGRIVAGRLVLMDQGGREASTLFYMEYVAGGPGLQVSSVDAAAYYSGEPDSRLYVVPSDALNGQPREVFADYNRLLAFVVDNAISPDTGALPDEARPYVVFAFLTQRISPSAMFDAKVSDSGAGKGGYKQSSRYLNFNDWRVALVPGKFNLRHIKPLYFKLVVGGGEEVGFFSRGTALVGLYSSWNEKPH